MSNLQKNWFENMNRLKTMHSDIAELLLNKKVAFLDCPVYFNFGDILIWQGTEQFFKDYNIDVVYRAEADNVSQKKLNDVDVIVFQGGGNFGDLYPRVQKMRERVLKNNPDKRIVCLPQTIHYSSNTNFKKSVHEISQHGDFHFFARDSKTKQLAIKFTSNVKMMPDMAHSLHPLVDASETGPTSCNCKKILFQKRNDAESIGIGTFSVKKQTFDWDDIVTLEDRVIRKIFNNLSKLGVSQDRLVNFWSVKAKELQNRAIDKFYSKTLIVTDRLHGMILATLLGKECEAHDNSYGKNSSYYQEWLCNIEFVRMNISDICEHEK
jgi:pyruvyl transferase EpsO